MNFTLHLGSLLIALLAVFELVACGGGKDEEVPRQLIATAGFRGAAVPVFDGGRARFYTSLETSVFAVDPANGAQIPLFDNVADAPGMEPVYPVPILRNVLSLSWSRNYLIYS